MKQSPDTLQCFSKTFTHQVYSPISSPFPHPPNPPLLSLLVGENTRRATTAQQGFWFRAMQMWMHSTRQDSRRLYSLLRWEMHVRVRARERARDRDSDRDRDRDRDRDKDKDRGRARDRQVTCLIAGWFYIVYLSMIIIAYPSYSNIQIHVDI